MTAPRAPATVPEFNDNETDGLGPIQTLLRDLSVKADACGSILLSASQMRAIAESVGAFKRPA